MAFKVLLMHFSWFFWVEYIVRYVFEAHKKWDAMFFVLIPTIKYHCT